MMENVKTEMKFVGLLGFKDESGNEMSLYQCPKCRRVDIASLNDTMYCICILDKGGVER